MGQKGSLCSPEPQWSYVHCVAATAAVGDSHQPAMAAVAVGEASLPTAGNRMAATVVLTSTPASTPPIGRN